MSTWTKKERFLAVLSGEIADRPPISAWGHFVGREETAIDLAQATIEFQKEYDWDFIKVNPRATIFGEAWGNVSDFNNYVGDVPAISHHLVRGADELNKIQELDPTKGAFGEQLEATRLIKENAGEDTPVLQTIFTPMAIVEYLCGHRTVASSRSANRKLSPLSNLIEEHPEDLHLALQAIAHTLVNYIQHAIKAGADGFFYAVLGLARDGFLSPEEFKEFGTKYDLMLLEAAKDTSLLMHTCGPQSNPERFKDYPVHSIHWADNALGNPSLVESISWNKKCLMGGVDEELFKDQDSNRVIHEARKTIQALKDHPFILAPGCGLPVGTNAQVLRDFRDIF